MNEHGTIKFEDIPQLLGTLITEVEESKEIIFNLEKNQLPSINKTYTVEEGSEYLRVRPSTLREKLKRKEIGASKIGKEWRFTQYDLDEFLKKTHVDSTYETAQKYTESN